MNHSTTVVEATSVVSVIVPTLFAHDNLAVFIPRVVAALVAAGVQGEIVVVDEHASAETQTICERLAQEFPIRRLVRQEKRGFSAAVLHGIHHARGDVFVIMQADLSHPPEMIPTLLDALRSTASDFVIGSPAASGADSDNKPGLLRRAKSRVATWLTRPLTTANDPFTRFFCVPRETVAAAEPLDPIGHHIALELLVKSRCRNIHEVPVQSSAKSPQQSTRLLAERIDFWRHLKRLYEFKFRSARLVQFVTVGTSGMLIDLSVFSLLLLVIPLPVARAVAIWVAMTWNFWLNRRLTFSYARREPPLRQYLLFCASCMLGAVVNWTVSMALCAYVPLFDRWTVSAAFLGAVGGTAFNYVLSSRFVFVVRKPAAR
jgi:dolichol-phosphate mannosyltransferase